MNTSDGELPPGHVRESVNTRVLTNGSVVEAVRAEVVSLDDAFSHGDFRVTSSGELLYRDMFVAGGVGEPFYADTNSAGLTVISCGGHLYVKDSQGVREIPDSTPLLSVSMRGGEAYPGRVLFTVQGESGLCSPPIEAYGPTQVVSSDDGMLYATRPDGADMYLVGPVRAGQTVDVAPPDSTDALLPPEDLEATPFPARRSPVTLTSNRLVAAMGSMVVMSEPFRYAMFRMAGAIGMSERVEMVAALGELLYVGTRAGTFLVTGLGTDEMAVRLVAPEPVLSYSFVRVPGHIFGLSGELVAWATRAGIQLGTSDGVVRTPSEGRFTSQAAELGILTFVDNTFYYLQRG